MQRAARDSESPAAPTGTDAFSTAVALGERFEFGKNWRRFLDVLDEDRISEAQRSLQEMLGVESLAGRTFLDIGSGSGLFSLAAMRLGADRVHSLDFDPTSVACTRELKRRYYPDVDTWTVDAGDALDAQAMQSLGMWDVVYSWGVLHHTGSMWEALANVAALVREGGMLFISIYNDQGVVSRGWSRVKRFYNRGPAQRVVTTAIFVPYFVTKTFIASVLSRRNPLAHYRAYKRQRGMSVTHDWLDWLGGYPFEVAKPEEIFSFLHSRGYTLERLTTAGRHLGCNEYVFVRPSVS
jgi:2-polyprenyl-3-methyl-5-hydroxy-6-metoxy-1,4-benzoquinol methylase